MKRYILMTLLTTASAVASPERAKTIETFFNAVNRDSMHLLDDFYADDVHFVDPLGELHGLEPLRSYYQRMYQPVTAIRFEFSEIQQLGTDAFATWIMVFSSSKLRGGRAISVGGVSHLRFGPDQKVVYHRDYFDLGEMVYEHVPVLGWFTRCLKRRIGDHP